MSVFDIIMTAAILLLALFTIAFFFGPQIVSAFLEKWAEWEEIIKAAKGDE